MIYADGSIRLTKPSNNEDPLNLIKVIRFDSKGQRSEEEYKHEFDANGNLIRRVELLNGTIAKEITWIYNDMGLPTVKQTAGGEAFIKKAQSERGESYGIFSPCWEI